MSSAPRFLPPRLQRPSIPAPTPVAQALRDHAALARLGERLEGSRRRLRLIAPALPGPNTDTNIVAAAPPALDPAAPAYAHAGVLARFRFRRVAGG